MRSSTQRLYLLAGVFFLVANCVASTASAQTHRTLVTYSLEVADGGSLVQTTSDVASGLFSNSFTLDNGVDVGDPFALSTVDVLESSPMTARLLFESDGAGNIVDGEVLLVGVNTRNKFDVVLGDTAITTSIGTSLATRGHGTLSSLTITWTTPWTISTYGQWDCDGDPLTPGVQSAAGLCFSILPPTSPWPRVEDGTPKAPLAPATPTFTIAADGVAFASGPLLVNSDSQVMIEQEWVGIEIARQVIDVPATLVDYSLDVGEGGSYVLMHSGTANGLFDNDFTMDVGMDVGNPLAFSTVDVDLAGPLTLSLMYTSDAAGNVLDGPAKLLQLNTGFHFDAILGVTTTSSRLGSGLAEIGEGALTGTSLAWTTDWEASDYGQSDCDGDPTTSGIQSTAGLCPSMLPPSGFWPRVEDGTPKPPFGGSPTLTVGPNGTWFASGIFLASFDSQVTTDLEWNGVETNRITLVPEPGVPLQLLVGAFGLAALRRAHR